MVKENKDTTKSLDVVSRSSVIDDPLDYQSSKNFSSNTKIDLCSGVKDPNRCLVSALSRIARIRIDKNNDPSTLRKSSEKLSNAEDQKYRSDLEKKKKNELALHQGNCRCYVIEDVYMPESSKKLPAYVCQLYNKIFFLTSERFLEDRRSYFDIYVNEEMLQNWIVAASNADRTVGVKKLPVTLVLKNHENNYRIRNKS
ncbi:hypothetical protein M0802_009193 [Mischocyttarus mexicanus]|nr:hypothetical protein M0802_009193 [Mischocyttarus mexicanus]